MLKRRQWISDKRPAVRFVKVQAWHVCYIYLLSLIYIVYYAWSLIRSWAIILRSSLTALRKLYSCENDSIWWMQISLTGCYILLINFQHESYSSGGTYPNDIAALTLTEAAGGIDILPISKLDNYTGDYNHTNCFITGWGNRCGKWKIGLPVTASSRQVSIVL